MSCLGHFFGVTGALNLFPDLRVTAFSLARTHELARHEFGPGPTTFGTLRAQAVTEHPGLCIKVRLHLVHLGS